MDKTIYIIPGFTEKTDQKAYQEIIEIFRSQGFDTVPVDISWKHNTMSDYLKEFLDKVREKNKNDVYFFGFSFGAMIAFICATKINSKALILCSLSPYFREDLYYLKKTYKKTMGKKELDDFKKYSFNDLSKKIDTKTILIIGGKEDRNIKRRVYQAHKKIKNNKLIVISDAKHKISQRKYLDAIKKVISTL